MTPTEMVGKRYGRLLVIEQLPSRRNSSGTMRRFVRAICDCGQEVVRKANGLQMGSTKSCGCWKIAAVVERCTTHGDSTTKRYVPEFWIWCELRQRCFNEKNKKWPYYGGRGVTVCDRWRESYEAFLADMGRRPSPKHSIDRFPDNDGPYAPDNCRWATATEQVRNRRNSINVVLDGKSMSLIEACEMHGIKYNTARLRIRRWGRTPEQAILMGAPK